MRTRSLPQARTEDEAADLDDFVEHGTVGLHRLAVDGTVLWANRREYEPLGYQRDEYVGHDWREFHAEPNLVDEMLERLARGEQVHALETIMYERNGQPRHVLVSASARVDEQGRFRDTRGFTQDISQQKRAEQRAAAERAELLRAEQANRERIVLLARASDALSEALDYECTLGTLAELTLPLLGDFGFFEVHEGEDVLRFARADRDPAGDALLRATDWSQAAAQPEGGAAPGPGECMIVPTLDLAAFGSLAGTAAQAAALQQLQACSMLSVPLQHQGETIGALRLYFGVSGRRHCNDDLALAVELARRASCALVRARLLKEARDAIGARDDFLSLAGHELRTPLTALQLQVLSITKLAGQPDSVEKLAARADKAGRNVLRLSSLVNELLDISRIGAGRLQLERAPMDLADAVRGVLYRQAEELAKHGCEVHFSAEGEVSGTWDRVRIEQIATKLLANALAYGKGKPIEICVQREDGRARLWVQDHGSGIAPEDQARIFQRFERAVSSRHFSGLGLGLWIARQLVEAHGGSIRVTSAVNQGATLEVLLPVTPPHASTGELGA
jgi:PAS domain S-box-containing protein